MKRGMFLIIAMLAAVLATFSFFFPNNSSAALMLVPGDQMVWDDRGTGGDVSDDMYWVQNLRLFTNKTYDQQLATISALSIDGYSDFHLASSDEVSILFNNGALTVLQRFPPTYTGWFGRTSINGRSSTASGIGSHWTAAVSYDGGYHAFVQASSLDDNYPSSTTISAWVVGNKVPEPVPEPSTMLLLGSGLVGLIGYGRRRFKK